ncbi:hypothetical protein DF185_08160 [Marinifilum breve]|uniref:TonB C-terminal domain-containing protein n=1 Tax=Marinifilum breve TaxID=2184082 RepID=A0A2V3ZYA9_9BACT|nr:energy transducer TonB [Marinifilum breve]PXY01449.1 hypothetical protein DF185_08160 [Marinifilum breve]
MKKHTSLLIAFLAIANLIYCQNRDTVYYSNGLIRSITMEVGEKKELIVLNDFSGQDIMNKGDFIYEYFDSEMSMTRYLDIQNKSILKEYWINQSDTIFNSANFDDGFINLVISYHRKVSSKVKYPKGARKRGVQGKVMISFIVDKSGEIKNIKPITDIGYGLEQSAVEVINRKLNFGKICLEGKPVSCYFKLPINFILR